MSNKKKTIRVINIVIFTEDANDTKQFLDIQKQKIKDAYDQGVCEYLSNDTKLNIVNLHYKQDLLPTVNHVISDTGINQKYTHVFLVFDKDTTNTLQSGGDSKTIQENWRKAEQKINSWNKNCDQDNDAKIKIIGMNPCFEWGLAQLLAKKINSYPKQCKDKSGSIKELNRILEQYSKLRKNKQSLTYNNNNKEKIWTLVDLCSYKCSYKWYKDTNKRAKGDTSDSANNKLNYSEFYKLFEIDGYESK